MTLRFLRLLKTHFSLAKGSSHHWDLLVVAILNIFLSIVGLPWMHGALPSAFLHLKALSDVEERLHNGRVQQVLVFLILFIKPREIINF